jgi:hypothetical protein
VSILDGTIHFPPVALPFGVFPLALLLAACGAAGGCAAGLVAALLRRVDLPGLLLKADQVLGSRELTSTALELLHGGEPGIFNDAVLEDAAQLLAASPARTILGPLKLRLLPFAALAALLTAAGLLFPVNLLSLFPSRVDAARELDQIGEDLRERGQRLAEDARAHDLGRSLALSQELAQLGDDLAARRIQPDEALDRMSELEAGLAEEYQLRMQQTEPGVPQGREGRQAGTPGGPGRPGKAGDSSQGEALADNQDRPAGSSGKGAAGDRSLKDLGDTLDSLRQGRRQLQDQRYGDSAQAQGSPRPGRQRSPSEGQAGTQGLPPGQGQYGQSPQQGRDPGTVAGGTDDRAGSAPQGTGAPGEGVGNQPGPKRGSPTAITQGSGPALRVQGDAAGGDSTRLLARALPEWTGSRLPEAAILNRYSRQAESALARDEVPLKLKQYVKDYFTTIGISK